MERDLGDFIQKIFRCFKCFKSNTIVYIQSYRQCHIKKREHNIRIGIA